MSFLLATSFVTINPEIEKFHYVKSQSHLEPVNTEMMFDLKSRYLVCNEIKSKNDLLMERISLFHISRDADSKISSRVLINTYNLVNVLSPLLLEKLDLESVYTTPYGTVVFDWEKDSDNVFSLEIGADKIGYFIEVDGVDQKKVDNIDFEKNKKELLSDLSLFLSK